MNDNVETICKSKSVFDANDLKELKKEKNLNNVSQSCAHLILLNDKINEEEKKKVLLVLIDNASTMKQDKSNKNIVHIACEKKIV